MAGWVQPNHMGLATLRTDGFTHIQARDGFGPGVLSTVPIQFKNPDAVSLSINASALMPHRDWVEVEVLDAQTGAPLPGYAKNECEGIAADATSAVVGWRGVTGALGAVSVPQIKLRLYLYGKAKPHSFSFQRIP